MNIPNDFSLSYHGLLRNKSLIVPKLIGSFVSILLILILLFATGFFGIAMQYSSLISKYQQEHKTISGQVDNKELAKYLGSNNFSFLEFKKLLNWQNLALAILIISAIIVINYYLSAVLYAMVSYVVKNKKLDYNRILNSSFWLMFRLAWYDILMILIVGVPILVLVLGVVLFFALNKWLGVLSLIVVILLAIAYIIFMVVRLIFARPMMFIEDQKALSSLKISYSITKGRFKEAIIIFAILFGIGLAFGLAGNMWSRAIMEIFAFNNVASLLINSIVIILYFAISSAVMAIIHLFLFYSYLDFKTNKNAKGSKQKT